MAGKINRSMEEGRKEMGGLSKTHMEGRTEDEEREERMEGGRTLMLCFLKHAAWPGVHRLLL